MTFLVPGIGAQGGDLQAVMKAGLNNQGLGLIINSSRGIIFSEDPESRSAKTLRGNHKIPENFLKSFPLVMFLTALAHIF